MITDYQCNEVYFSSWLKSDYSNIYNGLEKILNKHNITYGIIPHTKDVWCRDYMPLQIDEYKYLCYNYRPDYLTKNPINHKYITDSQLVCHEMNLKTIPTSLIIDGGNVVKAGNRIIMTEKVFFENPNVSKEGIKREIENKMECEVIFIPWDKEEKYGHSDGIVKPISDDAVLLTNYHDFDSEYTNEVVKRLKGIFDIASLSYKAKELDQRSWAYINFLTVGNLIILPALGIEEDEQALSQIKQYYPNCIIEQLNVSKLVKDRGGLNCISWCRYVNKKNPYVKSFSKKTNQT